MSMRAWRIFIVLILLPACGGRPGARPGAVGVSSPDNACFGGTPELVAEGVDLRSLDFDSPAEPYLFIGAGSLIWQGFDGPTLVNLATRVSDHREHGAVAYVKAADAHEIYSVAFPDPMSTHSDLVAVDVDTGKSRIVVAGTDKDLAVSATTRVVLDGEYLYFIREQHGFIRARRDGSGTPERIGAEPRGMNTPFLIDGGYVYWNSDESEGAPALWRRALSPESPIEYLASTKNDHVPLYIDHGRLFFVDAARIASVPVDGAAQPTPHAPDTQPGRTSVVADGTCVYWTSERGIYRSRLIGTSAPELIADERSYRSGPVVTDGQRLYWTDRRHNRILSLGRAAGSQPEPPVLVAKAINAEGMRSAVVDFPPPAGTSWSARHLINNGCDRGPTTLPACEAQTTGESWASILPKADGLNNHRVSVRDRLVVGPLVPLSLGDITCADLGLDPPAQEPGRRKEPAQPEESSSCDRDRRYIVLGTTPPPLRVWGQGWESFLCVGDESRQCCGSPAFGQMVVATGVLEGSSRRGWGLRDVTMCELPAR